MMILLGAVVVLLALLGTPLFVIIGASALLAYHRAGEDSMGIMIELYGMADMPVLVSIPLFTFAGCVLGASDAPKRLVRLSRALLGWMPGGLAVVALVACAFFTAFTGASGITIIALGGLLFPALTADRYPEKFSLGLMTTAGSLGLLFPPSLPLILYGIVASTSIDDLFIAGLLPGVLLVVLLSGYSMIVGAKTRLPRSRPSWREVRSAVLAAGWEIPIPVIVLGGIYSGFLAVSDAAAVTAFVVLIVEVCIYRDVKIRELPKIVRESMMLVGGILVIMGVALGYTNYLIIADVPMQILAAIRDYIRSPVIFLILLNVFLLIVGCMMDIFSALVVVVPLIAPIASEYNIDPVHLGIIFLTNLQIGYCTPPVGLNLFIASYRFKRPVVSLYIATIPFLLILLVALAIITYVPSLSLALLPASGN